MEPLHDPPGHRWEKPSAEACPNCQCCTRRLCEQTAAKNPLHQNCAYDGERALWDQLLACPCPRAHWTDGQRAGTECIFCGKPAEPAVGMNAGLVAACDPCLEAYRAEIVARGSK
jgi:hypothetical protein